ncbi:MAG: hypothetical protein V1718_05955, partial [archaeon]
MDNQITGESLRPIFDEIQAVDNSRGLEQLLRLSDARAVLLNDKRSEKLSIRASDNEIAAYCSDKTNWFDVAFERKLFRAAHEIMSGYEEGMTYEDAIFRIGYNSCGRGIKQIGIKIDSKSIDPGGFYRKTPIYVNLLNNVWRMEKLIHFENLTEDQFINATSPFLGVDDAFTKWGEVGKRYAKELKDRRLNFISIAWMQYNFSVSFDRIHYVYTKGILSGVPRVIGLPDPEVIVLKKPTSAPTPEDSKMIFGIAYLSKVGTPNPLYAAVGTLYNLFTARKTQKQEKAQDERFQEMVLDQLYNQIKQGQEIQRNLENTINERTLELNSAYQTLKQTQDELIHQEVAKAQREKELQTEKAMSGGLAHEGRNALMPAAIQIRRLMEYQEKQSAFDILSSKSGSLLNQIMKIENEFNIPQELVNKEIIPIFRDINDLIKDIDKTTEEISTGVGKGLGLIDLFRTYSKTQEMTRGV